MKKVIGILSVYSEVNKFCENNELYNCRKIDLNTCVSIALMREDLDCLVVDFSYIRKIGFDYLHYILGQRFGRKKNCSILVVGLERDLFFMAHILEHPKAEFCIIPCDKEKLYKKIDFLIEKNGSYQEMLADQRVYYGDDVSPVFNSTVMKSIHNQLAAVSSSNHPILILGPSGSGKTHFAKFIHESSSFSASNFLAVNCGSVSETLAESEFFGTRANAYTGAIDRLGYFECCKDGTLFLDEIGELSLTMQAKILQVLDTGTFLKLGSSEVYESNARLIFATNRNLQEMVDAKLFRFDLYQRISGFKVTLPTLKERREDILPLAKLFLGESGKSLTLEVEDFFLNYDWPGNIRQLKHCINRALFLSKSHLIQMENLDLEY